MTEINETFTFSDSVNTEEIKPEEKCLRCENKGFTICAMVMSNQGPVKYEIRPGDPIMEKVMPKDMIFEKCDCPKGNDFFQLR